MRRTWACAAILLGLVLSAQAAVPPWEKVAAGGNDIVATAKWDTPGMDIDLVILGPNNQTFKAQQDFMTGPATEMVSIPNPGPGEYKVGVVWQNDKPNMQVAVTVEVSQGGRQVGSFPVVLSAGNPNDRKIVTALNVGAGPAPAPNPFGPFQPAPAPGGGGDLVVTMKWQTLGTDVDLAVVGPNNQSFKAMNDVTSGPGEETVVIRNPGPGDYKVAIFYADSKGQQTPVTVDVKLGGRQVGTYQAVLQRDRDMQFVTTVNVAAGAGPGPGPVVPNPFGPGPVTPTPAKDPLGFAGKWTEYWPGVSVHDVSEIGFENGQYQVRVSNPQSGPYRVDNVRVEGNVLKFTEYPGNNTIHYEVRIQDANTCTVMVQGGPAAQGAIVWRRDMAAGPILPPAGATGNLVATLKWETQGTDIDLAVMGPNNMNYKPANDVTSGPGAEVCTIQNPVPGDYKVIAIYANSKGGLQSPVAAEVKLGDKVLTNQVATLTRDGEVKLVATVTVPGGVGPGPGPAGRDPIGYVGTWVEDWPGVGDHDVSVVTWQNGQYSIVVSNPKTGPYRVDSVRLDGNVLHFTEYPGNNTIQYSVTLQDPNTCSVQVQGGPAPRGPVVWRRQGSATPGF